MITLEIAEVYQDKVEADSLERAAVQTLTHEGLSASSGISIVVTDDAQLQNLNRQFLGIEAPTDVLSFPAGFTDPDTGAPYLGDVIVSFPRSEAQASAAEHTVKDELQLLVVHGVLHLLGYDHLEKEDKARMWAVQEEILEELGVSGVNPTG
jgi:probable rRNA maturation factor